MIRILLVLGAACALAGCAPRRARPHGTGVARAALSHDGFAWRTVEADGIHLHYLPGGFAAAHAPERARAAATALRYDLALVAMPGPAEPVELFLVSSREQARALTGNGFMGQAIAGELTAFLVDTVGKRLAFRHEIMHALSLQRWGLPASGPFLSEGLATWAGGGCQGHSIDAVAAGFLRQGTLPPLDSLAAHFREVDELRGYATAASAVGFVMRAGGPSAVRTLWQAPHAPGMHPLGSGGKETEAAWRRHLSTVTPARLDTARLRLHGCQTP
jgi:hypothetical protein